MQTDFYGTIDDKKMILDFIFAETNYHVFDHYSDFGEELNQYFSTDEILEKFDLEKGAIAKDLYRPEIEREAHELDWKLIRSDQKILKKFIEKEMGTANKIRGGTVLINANKLIEMNKLKIDR